MRDMPILLDGAVAACRETSAAEDAGAHSLGNIFEEEPEAIWRRGDALYEKQRGGEYEGGCGRCDEYYTYNF
jgi:MoaA/NifB/PqqE/SkfB family radical SAM enzyme